MSELNRQYVRQLYQSIKLGGPVKLAFLFEESNKAMSEYFSENNYYIAYSLKKIFDTFNMNKSEENYYKVKWFLKTIKQYMES